MKYRLKEWILNLIYLWKTKFRIKCVKNGCDSKQKSILMLRTVGIGDFILFLSGASKILKEYQGWEKVLICHPCCKELAEAIGLWDEVICFDYVMYKSSIRYQKQIEQIMSGIYADKFLNMEYSRTLYTEIITKWIQASEKYSFDGSCLTTDYIRAKSNQQYTKLLPVDVCVMELDKYIQYAAWFLGHFVEKHIYYLPVMADFWIKEKEYYVVAPGASYSEKMWPVERYAELIEKLWEIYHLPCCLSGGPEGNYLADKISSLLGNGKTISYIGKTSLTENFELIRGARFLIGNDSASVHIAAAVRTQSFCITGGWDLERFLPYTIEGEESKYAPTPIRVKMKCYGCAVNGGITRNRVCNVIPNGRYSDDRKFGCIEAVNVDMVIDKIREEMG